MPGRQYTGTAYRFGFNGKEEDNEVSGNGNQNDYGFRIFNPRLGRFLSVDPVAAKYPGLTPYQFASDRPIDGIDLDGLEWKDSKGNQLTNAQLKVVKVYILYSREFDGQAAIEYRNAIKNYGEGSAALSMPTTTAGFSEDWGNIQGQPSLVVIDMHGKNQSITTEGGGEEQLTATGDGKTNISGRSAMNIQDLPDPKANLSGCELELNTCHSNDKEPEPHNIGQGDHEQGELKGSKKTVAQVFLDKFFFKNVRGTSGPTNYRHWYDPRGKTGTPYPQNKKWDILGPIIDSPLPKSKESTKEATTKT